MAIETINRLCKCGCHKDTHFESAGACLGMRCDCQRFRDPSEPDELPPRPKHASWCRCFICKQYAAKTSTVATDNGSDTEPTIPAALPFRRYP